MFTKFPIYAVLFFMVACSGEKEPHLKDLDQNMLDLKIYQENLGDHVKQQDLKDASWLLEGIDSILLILSNEFDEHRKLGAPFSYYYKKQMRPPIKDIRAAIRDNDTAKALKSYRVLINNCNDCHIDNEIDKEVKF